MLQVRRLAIPEVLEITPKKFGDARGFFAETFNRSAFAESGLETRWVQDNQSFSGPRFTLRGLHYQAPPFDQDKLVRVLKGRILDVAVDIRAGSPSFGRWVALEVTADAFNQILVPKGFAHGFLTLEDNSEVFYKVSAPYSREHDRSIRWNDPDIAVDWRLGDGEPVLSDKDRDAPSLREIRSPFVWSAGE